MNTTRTSKGALQIEPVNARFDVPVQGRPGGELRIETRQFELRPEIEEGQIVYRATLGPNIFIMVRGNMHGVKVEITGLGAAHVKVVPDLDAAVRHLSFFLTQHFKKLFRFFDSARRLYLVSELVASDKDYRDYVRG